MVKFIPKHMIIANVQEGCYPVIAAYQNEEELNENIGLFKEKGLIHNPDYWMSLDSLYLKPSKIRVYELKNEIKSPKVGE